MLARATSALAMGRRPPIRLGMAVALTTVALCTGAVYPLKQVAPVSSLGVVYLLGVVTVSSIWGLWLGIATSVLSAASYNFFHLPPVGRFTIADSRDWVALTAFFAVAIAASSVSELARRRAAEAQERRAEADLTAQMAQLLLEGTGVQDALALIGHRLAVEVELPWASVTLENPPSDERRESIPLGSSARRIGTLVVPAALPKEVIRRLRQRIVPALSAVVEVALERERLIGEAVETEGLRRSEAIKTAVLRSVSHDLRSPVTAMVTAGAAMRDSGISEAERAELGSVVVAEGTRLAGLIDDLLDLSRLEADRATPRLADCLLDEVIEAAMASQPLEPNFEVHIDPDLAAVRADFVQLERALANLLENAGRYSGGEPVVIRARQVGDRAVVRIIDRGPGVPAVERERIFEPFYRAAGQTSNGHAGSGLGLAIAKGFVETNGGRIWVESSEGQGSTFVVELPTQRHPG